MRRKRKPKPTPYQRQQRAFGFKGQCARWANDLSWHRKWQAEAWSDFTSADWKTKFWHAVCRAAFLRFAIGKKWPWVKQRHRLILPPAVKAELLPFAELANVSPELVAWWVILLAFRSVDGMRNRVRVKWRRTTIAWMLKASPRWSEELLQMGTKQQAQESRQQMTRQRQALLLGQPVRPSIRKAHEILTTAGFEVSETTARNDLKAISFVAKWGGRRIYTP